MCLSRYCTVNFKQASTCLRRSNGASIGAQCAALSHVLVRNSGDECVAIRPADEMKCEWIIQQDRVSHKDEFRRHGHVNHCK